MIFEITLYTCASKANFKIQFWIVNNIFEIFKKMAGLIKKKKKKDNFWNQIFENSLT